MLYSLQEIRKWGKGKDFRIFIAGNYRKTDALGLLQKMAHWIESFEADCFYPILMKDFEVPPPDKEPDWFKEFIKNRIIGIIPKKERDVLKPEEMNQTAASFYLIENCGYIFGEFTTFGGGGSVPEFIYAYIKDLCRYVFIEQGHSINPTFRAFITGSNLHHYSSEDNLRQLINTILRTILTERSRK